MYRKKLKFGIDVHGVLDTLPELFVPLMKILVKSGCEVHIITGSKRGKRIFNTLSKFKVKKNVHYTHFFSISTYLINTGKEVRYVKGKPWFSTELWNKTKGEYCKKNNINIMIDDSDDYHHYFSTPYALLFNKKGEKNEVD